MPILLQKKTGLWAEICESPSDLTPDDWQVNGPFQSVPFLQVLHRARVENSKMWFIRIYQGEELLASAVLSHFRISLDLFIGDEAWVRWLNRRFPNLFKVGILFCGTPVSIGHNNLALNTDFPVGKILQLLSEKMEVIAKENKISHLVIKELNESDRKGYKSALEEMSWFEGFSIPDVKMPLPWNSYEDYLHELRAPYRRQILQSVRKMNNGRTVEDYKTFFNDHFRILPASAVPVKAFFELYLQVMDRTPVKLETLNLAFFEHFFAAFADEIRIFTLANKPDSGYFLTLQQADTLYFLWTARAQDQDADDSYFNLYQAILYYAIQERIPRLHLGQTAYYAKMRIGGRPEERYLFYKCLNKLQNRVLRSLRKLLFPRPDLPELSVFKTSQHE